MPHHRVPDAAYRSDESLAAEQSNDEAVLHRFGYAQVLRRGLTEFGNFGISFTIISVLSGCLNSYYVAFNNGGPVAITWGWLLVGVFCILVALAMSEIASAMPTAGALYFWAAELGGAAYGWFTGWFNLVGQIAITAAINYGAAVITTALLDLWFPSLGNDTTTIFVVYTALLAAHLAFNLLRIDVLAKLYSLSVWWHITGIALIGVVLLVVPTRHQSASFVFGETINNSGFGGSGWSQPAFWFACGIGLLMAQYTITGFDASAHMSEETRSRSAAKGASRATAWGLVASVAVSVVAGFVLLVAVTFAVRDVPGTTEAGAEAVVYIWTTAMPEGWAEFLLVIAVAAQLFCGVASVTSASRMLFAFSRDNAVPLSRLWRQLSARNRVPVNAAVAIVGLAWLLMLPTLVNGAIGYLVGTSVAVIGLYISYAIPIALRIRAGSRFPSGEWSLGRHYRWICPLAVGWIAAVCVLFLMPVSPAGIPGAADFDWQVVNYAPLTVGAALAFFGWWYWASARKWFLKSSVQRRRAGSATSDTAVALFTKLSDGSPGRGQALSIPRQRGRTDDRARDQ